ncbi:HAD family phosphatase [Tropicimonas sp. IMCC34011]|uniref:HAD family hydrolase n=1 Tax=Tropicimonas sp. IMCC34011 TaxID=2248759 RepID=UPI000E26068F|nr:HAD-IA family hydrolase [Tropicimonas sp. IMCC34011]
MTSAPTPALLFDLDGTLLETDPLHAAVFKDLFAELGKEIDDDFYYTDLHGWLNADIFGKHFPDRDPAALADEKEARVRARLDEVSAMPGLHELVERAEAEDWAMAVVTNAPRANAEAMLEAIGLTGRLGPLLIGDEQARAKPHPDPYLRAMELTGSTTASALAFEDSESGLRAAASAGLTAIGVRSSLDEGALRAAGAQATIKDFTDPALEPFLRRLEGARA